MLLQNYVAIKVRTFPSVKSRFLYWVPDSSEASERVLLVVYFAVKPVGIISSVPKIISAIFLPFFSDSYAVSKFDQLIQCQSIIQKYHANYPQKMYRTEYAVSKYLNIANAS